MGDVQRPQGAGVTRRGPVPVPAPGDVPPLSTRFWNALGISAYAAGIYGVTNAIAAARGTTRCIALPWEHHLPFIGWLVVLYLLVDLLMGCAALFAQSYAQLYTFRRRILWAFGIGNLIFLLLPLQCSFPRTIPDDWTGPLFRFLHFSDLPYNQAPSAHIYEAVLITPLYWTRFRAPLARALYLAIVISGSAATVLTYQHHVLDVITGLLFGVLFLKLIPGTSRTARPL